MDIMKGPTVEWSTAVPEFSVLCYDIFRARLTVNTR